MYKIACGVLIVLLIALQLELWVGQYSFMSIWHLSQMVASKEAVNQEWQLRNQRLLASVQNLKTGSQVIESQARMNLGMIKNGEVYYQVVNK